MDKHSEFLELSKVILRRTIDGTSVTVQQVLRLHRQSLLIFVIDDGGTKALFSLNTGRQYIRNRCTITILFKIHGRNVKSGLFPTIRGKIITILQQIHSTSTPFAAHQLKRGQTADHRLVEITHEDTHKTNRVET